MALIPLWDWSSQIGVSPFLPIGVWKIPEVSMMGETEQSLRAKGMAHVGRSFRQPPSGSEAIAGAKGYA